MIVRRLGERLFLVVLGVAAFPLLGLTRPLLGAVAGGLLVLFAIAGVAGAIEARASLRTHREEWFFSWMPVAIGMISYAAATTNPEAPDYGLALSLTVALFACLIPALGVLVNAAAWVLRRMMARH